MTNATVEELIYEGLALREVSDGKCTDFIAFAETYGLGIHIASRIYADLEARGLIVEDDAWRHPRPMRATAIESIPLSGELSSDGCSCGGNCVCRPQGQ